MEEMTRREIARYLVGVGGLLLTCEGILVSKLFSRVSESERSDSQLTEQRTQQEKRGLEITLDDSLIADIGVNARYILNNDTKLTKVKDAIRNTLRFSYLIDQYKRDLDRNLAIALIAHESEGDPNECSPKKACGLTQIIPETARDLG